MSTTADLPPSFFPDDPLSNVTGNGSWSADYDAQSGEQVVSWMGPFTDRLAFIEAALFKPETVTFPGGDLTKVIPLQCPYDDRLYAIKVSMRALTVEEAEDADPWRDIVATVRFGVLPYRVDGDTPLVQVRIRGKSKRITIPNFPYELIDESDAFVERVAADIDRPIAEDYIDITYHGITDLAAAIAVLDPLRDKVNSETVTLPDIGRVCLPGTLHFSEMNAAKTINFGSTSKSELSISLAYRPVEWNRYVASKDPHKGVFLRANPRPIESADLNGIFGA